jgi:hypothetical protein
MVPASYQVPAAVLFLVGGLLACFLGYRVFRLVLAIYGFVLGALIATSFLAPVESTWTLVTAVVGGLIGAAVLVLAYFVGVAFVGAALAALLVHLAWTRIGGEPHPVVVVVACVLGALASMAVQQYVIVVGTAFAGAWTGLIGGLLLMGSKAAQAAASKGDVWLAYPLNPAPDQRWLTWAWLVLGAVGVAVQLNMGGAGRPRARGARAKRKAA